jgi:hypothetical protein
VRTFSSPNPFSSKTQRPNMCIMKHYCTMSGNCLISLSKRSMQKCLLCTLY